MWRLSALCSAGITFLGLGITCQVQAQSSPVDTLAAYTIDEVVVTAARLAVPYTGLPFSAEVITARDIAMSNANSPTDAAAALPGVFVEKTGDFGRSDVVIRGLGNNGRQVTVLMDGHPVKMGLFGCTITHALPLAAVEQIEVIKAPASVLYGSDALGGVLNIVTAQPPRDLTLRVNTVYGSNSTWKTNVFHGSQHGPAGYMVSYDHGESAGHLPNSAYWGDDVLAKVRFRPGTTDVSFLVKYFSGRKEEPAMATEPETAVSDVWNRYDRGAVDLEIRKELGGLTSSFKTYDEFGEHRFSDGWHSKDHALGGLLRLSGEAANRLKFDTGLEFREQQGRLLSAPEGEWSKYEYACYLYSRTLLTPGVNASLGLRFNQDEISGQAWAPLVGLNLDLTGGTTLALSASKGFRSPQINELYLFPSSHTDLSAETVWSYELGLTSRFEHGRLTASLFNMIGEDLIELVPYASPPPAFRYANTGRFDFTGAEASVVLFPLHAIETRLAYSYLNPGRHTTGRPGRKVDAGTTVRIGPTTVAANLQYVGDYYAGEGHSLRIDDYTIVDMRIGRSLASHLEGFVSVENITDEAYSIYAEIPGGSSGVYRMPGRRYLAGVAFYQGG
jgi:outer membrane cobalamin receptor